MQKVTPLSLTLGLSMPQKICTLPFHWFARSHAVVRIGMR